MVGHELHGQVARLAHDEGRADEDDPDEEVACQLLGPFGRPVEDVAGTTCAKMTTSMTDMAATENQYRTARSPVNSLSSMAGSPPGRPGPGPGPSWSVVDYFSRARTLSMLA